MQTIEIAKLEPLSGYLSRLAASRGVRLWDFRIHCGIQARYKKKPRYYEHVSNVTGIDPESLKRHDLVKVGGTFNAFDMTFDVNDIWAKSARACLCCIREDIEHGTGRKEARPWLRFGWMLRTLGRCPIHEVPLVQIGPDYDSVSYGDFVGTLASHQQAWKIEVHREDSDKSNTLGNADAGIVDARVQSDAYFHDRIVATAAGSPAAYSDNKELRTVEPPQMLDRMPVTAALLVTEVIGGMELFGDDYSRGTATGEERQAAVSAGYQITSRGYVGLSEFLGKRDQIHWKGTRRGNIRGLYGRFQEFLLSRVDVEAYDNLRRFVAEHAYSHHTLGPKDTFIGLNLPRRLHSIRTAEVTHGIHRFTLRSILDAAGLLPQGANGQTDGRIIIAADVFDKLISDWKERLPAEEAKARFNISGNALKGIILQGLIVEIDDDPRRRSRIGRPSFKKFEHFLNSLPAGIPDKGMRSLTDMTRKVGRSYGEIVNLMKERKITKIIRVADPEETWGFENIFVDPLEIKEAFEVAVPPGITLQYAERTIRTSTKTVKRLVASGLLKTVSARNPSKRKLQTYVLPSDLEEFQRTYISLFEYSTGRCHPVLMKKRLTSSEIHPAFEEEGAATFYRRDELPEDV
jgi:hypothetical protein